MKKMGSFLLCMCMLLALMAGCGGAPSKTVSDAAPTADLSSAEETDASDMMTESEIEPDSGEGDNSILEEADAQENELPPVELPLVEDTQTISAWMTMNSNSLNYMNGYEDNRVIQEMENRTNVHVDFTTVSGSNATELFQVMIASGSYTDIIGSPTTYSGGVDAGIADGIYLDLTDDLSELVPHYAKVLEANEQAAQEVKTATGKIGTIRMIRENTFQYLGMAIRQDWLDQLDMNIPETYDDLHDVLTAFKNEMSAEAALWLNPMGVMPLNWFTAGYGVAGTTDLFLGTTAFYPEDGIIKYGYAEKRFHDYLAMLNQWYSEGLVWKDFPTGGNGLSITQSDGYNTLLNHDMGVCFVQASDIDAISKEGVQMTGMPQPVTTAGDAVHTISLSNVTGAAVAINADSDNIDLVCRYLDYYFTEEGSMLCTYGIEGQSYTLENENPTFTDLILNNPDSIGFATALTIYALDDFPFLCDNSRLLVSYSENTVSSIENWCKNIDGAWAMPSGVQLTTDENVTYAASYGDISTYAMELIPQFITGAKNLSSDYDTFVQTMYDMGLQTCIDLYQGAYNRYIAG